jgi:Fe-S oxidoreductase
MGKRVLTFAEYIAETRVQFTASQPAKVVVHGHCHQKAMGVATATVDALNMVSGLDAEMIETSCCGMAGPFGYQAETEQVSRDMAELALAPAIRATEKSTAVVADGFSCRCQIRDVTGRKAENLARYLDRLL